MTPLNEGVVVGFGAYRLYDKKLFVSEALTNTKEATLFAEKLADEQQSDRQKFVACAIIKPVRENYKDNDTMVALEYWMARASGDERRLVVRAWDAFKRGGQVFLFVCCKEGSRYYWSPERDVTINCYRCAPGGESY